MSLFLDLKPYFPDTYPCKIAVAVSGGADSMALILLVKQWARDNGVHVVGLIVNHNIRPESTAEAQGVQKILESQNIESFILTNHKNIDKNSLQEQARTIRYSLLEKWCVANDVENLCIGHHYDDCLETVGIRQTMGSGLYGLAGMAPIRNRPFGRILRPCLGFSKKQLVQFCEKKAVHYVSDPSNYNVDFERVRVRQKLQTNAEYKREMCAIRNKAIAFRIYIDEATLQALKMHTKHNEAGFVILKASFFTLKKEIQYYALRHILMWVSGEIYGPRTEKLNLALRLLEKSESFTLLGCRGKLLQGEYYIFRELERMGAWVESTQVYDNRFVVSGDLDSNVAIKLGALGGKASSILKSLGVCVKKLGVPKTILPTIPAIFIESEPVNIMGFNFKNQNKYAIFHQNTYLVIYSPFNLEKTAYI